MKKNICVNVYDVDGWSELWYDWFNVGDLSYYGVSGNRKYKLKNSDKYRYCFSIGWQTGSSTMPTFYFTLNNIILGEYLQMQLNNKKIVYAGMNLCYANGMVVDCHWNGFFSGIRRGTWIFNEYVGVRNRDPYNSNGKWSTDRNFLKSHKYTMQYNYATNRLWTWGRFNQHGYWYSTEYNGGDNYLHVPGLTDCKFWDIRY